MFKYVFSVSLTMLRIFGKIPWMKTGKNEILNRFRKICPGLIASIAFIVDLLYTQKFVVPFLRSFQILQHCNNILHTTLSTYVFSNEWKKWFNLFNSLDKTMKFDSQNSKTFGIKVLATLIINTAYFFNIWIVLCFKEISLNNLFGVPVMFINLFSNLLITVLLMLLQEGFKKVNKYWKNIYKWSKMGLEVKNARNAAFCKKQYQVLHEMYICHQKIFGWILIFLFLELFFSTIIFIYLVVTTEMREHNWIAVMSVWGYYIQVLVSIYISYCYSLKFFNEK